MLDVIIIDHEPKALQSMAWELQTFCKSVVVVGTFSCAAEAKQYLDSNVVDCIFLDIEMPDMDGFQFLELFPTRNFAVVITTAFNQYAIKAIKEKALDYLSKPIDSDDLMECIDKIKLFKTDSSIHQKLEQTLENLTHTSMLSRKKISISCDGKIIFINPEEIVYCESDGNYCTIILENNDKILITQKLKFMEEKLAEFYFFRIHNSYLINLNKVKEYHKNDEYVVLSNKTKLPVSRLKKALFLDQL